MLFLFYDLLTMLLYVGGGGSGAVGCGVSLI